MHAEGGYRAMVYVFDDCTLDMHLCVLRRAGQVIRLRPRVLQVLIYLLEHRDRIVSKQELCEQVWSAAFVSDAALENGIKAARRAVGDSGRTQRVIQTRRGHGYRFVAEVTRSDPASKPAEEVSQGAEADSPRPLHAVGERKIVTILCCGFRMPLSSDDELGLDTLHSRMQVLYDLVQRAVSRYGGHLQPLAGDYVLAVFGAPLAQEDHAQRAVLAAFALRQTP